MKKTIFLPALLLLAGCADSPAENFAKAQDAFARHDYPVARVKIASALAKQPGDRAMLLLQARTLLALGDGEGAGSALEKLIGTSPAKAELAELSAEAALLRQAPDVALAVLGDANSVEADRLRALAAIQKRDTAKAGDYFAKAMAAGGNARVFADYCRFRLTAGDVAGAKELADRAAKASPDGIDTLLVGGLLALRQGDLKKSLELYGRAAKLYPTSLAALTGQAAVLGDLGRFDQMEAALARASAFAPKDLTVVYLTARAAAARKDWSAVRAAVQPIEAGLPQQDPIRLLYGEALLRLGQSELAMAQFTPMTRSGPGARLAVRLLGEAQLVSGDAQSALDTLRPLALLTDVRPEELSLIAKAAKQSGDPQAASLAPLAVTPAARALGTDLADADAAMRRGSWARAAAAYGRILAMTDGRNVLVLNNMANAQLMLGNNAKALEFAERALKQAPDNPSVLDTLGWVRFKSGRDLDEAKRLLRLAAKKAPANVAIAAHLAEAERAGS